MPSQLHYLLVDVHNRAVNIGEWTKQFRGSKETLGLRSGYVMVFPGHRTTWTLLLSGAATDVSTSSKVCRVHQSFYQSLICNSMMGYTQEPWVGRTRIYPRLTYLLTYLLTYSLTYLIVTMYI